MKMRLNTWSPHDDMMTWWHVDMMTWWHDRMLAWGDHKIMRSWDDEMMRCWDDEIMRSWDHKFFTIFISGFLVHLFVSFAGNHRSQHWHILATVVQRHGGGEYQPPSRQFPTSRTGVLLTRICLPVDVCFYSFDFLMHLRIEIPPSLWDRVSQRECRNVRLRM